VDFKVYFVDSQYLSEVIEGRKMETQQLYLPSLLTINPNYFVMCLKKDWNLYIHILTKI